MLYLSGFELCPRWVPLKKFINLVNMSCKLQKNQMKIHMRGSEKRINARTMLRKKCLNENNVLLFIFF